jgi:hypothetical protein
MYNATNLEDIAKMFDGRAADESRKMNSLAVSQKAKNDYKARMQTWTEAANVLRQTELTINIEYKIKEK